MDREHEEIKARLELLELETRLEIRTSELAAMPPGLQQVDDETFDRALSLEQRQKQSTSDLEARRRAVATKTAELEKLSEAIGPRRNRSAIAPCLARCAELRGMQAELAGLRRTMEAASGNLAETARQLRGAAIDARDDALTLPAPRTWEKLAESAESRDAARAEVSAWLSIRDSSTTTDIALAPKPHADWPCDPDKLADGRRSLMAWASHQSRGDDRSQTPVNPIPWIRVFSPIVVGAVVAGAWAAMGRAGLGGPTPSDGSPTPWLGLIAAGAVGMVAGLLWARRSAHTLAHPALEAPDLRERDVERFAAEYRASGCPEPGTWTPGDLQTVLRENLDQSLGLLLQAAHTRQAEQFQRELEMREQQLHASEQETRRRASELGLDPELPSVPLVFQVQRLEAVAQSRTTLAEARAVVDGQIAHHDHLKAGLLSWLDDIFPGRFSPQSDIVHIEHELHELERCLDRLATLTADQTQADDELFKSQREDIAVRTEQQNFFARLGLEMGDLQTLQSWQDQRPRHAELASECQTLELRVSELSLTLKPAVCAQWDRDQCEAKLSELADKIDDRERADRRRGELETRLHQAATSERLTLANAGLEQAIEGAHQQRETEFERTVTAGIVNWLRTSRRVEHAPQLLRAASAHLADITRGRYRLSVDEREQLVIAETTSERGLVLSRLSDATRIHALLAARLAFIESAEAGGLRMPLYLDEVLSTTDSGRFTAVVQALTNIAQNGRQVFYATADEAEIQAWRAALHSAIGDGGAELLRVHTLGPDQIGQWQDVPQLPQEAARQQLDHRVHDPFSYCESLRLPRPGLWDPIDAWPLVLLVYEDLAGIQPALEQGVCTWGAMRTLADCGRPLPYADRVHKTALRRATVVELVVDGFREGRGRPVSREAIAASGAVSDTFRTAIDEAFEQHGHDAVAFLAAVKNINRFLTKKHQQLSDHLENEGLLPTSAVASPEKVLERVRTHPAIAHWLELDELDYRQVAELVEWVRQLIVVRTSKPSVPGVSGASDRAAWG